MQTLIDNENATLKIYPEKKIVHHEFHKFLYGEGFKKFMLSGADAFTKNGCTKWLSDDRGNSAIRQEDLMWAQTTWEPKILKAGWKHWALIMPEKVVGQMNMKKLVERYQGLGVTVKVFSDTQTALNWLESQ